MVCGGVESDDLWRDEEGVEGVLRSVMWNVWCGVSCRGVVCGEWGVGSLHF